MGAVLIMTPHITVGTAVVLRLLDSTAELCEMQIACLSAGNFCGWLLMVTYLMLERRVGPFFIMVSEMIARDFVRFMVIPMTILPAFAIAFNTCVSYHHQYCIPSVCTLATSLSLARSAVALCPNNDLLSRIFKYTSHISSAQAMRAQDAHGNFGQSVFTLVLMGVGLGDETMFGGFGGGSDSRVMMLLLLYIMLIPILSLNLLVAMMADTYIDVRSAALNRWSLKQAQYVLSRQKYAAFCGMCVCVLCTLF